MKHSKQIPSSRKRFFKYILLILVLVGVWNVWKPLPKEIDASWSDHLVSSSQIKLLTDTTYLDSKGDRVSDQEIFDEIFSMIKNAKSYIFVDMFLWNDFGAQPGKVHRALSSELANTLIAKKQENPKIVIQVVSDPINSVYGGQEASLFSRMEKAGILVAITNLPSLRDSNPIISSFWRVFIYPIDYLHQKITGSLYTVRFAPNILNSGGENVTIRSYLSLLNFKANHRKLIVTDEVILGKQNLVSLVTSANPHDGSSAHSNIAVKIHGAIAHDILASEKRIVEMAGKTFIKPSFSIFPYKEGGIYAKLVTDKAIQTEVVTMIRDTQQGDSIDMLMFYLADRHVVKELIGAAKRGVTVRIILDPNKDAFGKQKNGIPNREIADTLVTKGGGNISIKWCNTHGEQCHAKVLIVEGSKNYEVILGSANFTRRNIGGYNLESDIVLRSSTTYPLWQESSDYFDGLWNNSHGTFSTEYATYEDKSTFKKGVAWIMENIGLGTF